MKKKHFIRAAIIAASTLLVPLIAQQFVEGFNWTVTDFLGMGAIIFIFLSIFEFVASKGTSMSYRIATGIGALTAFVLLWVNLAVGFIGEEHPGNGLYIILLALGLVGITLARLRPKGMAYTVFTLAALQLCIPVISFVFWKAELRTDFAPGFLQIMGISVIFAVGWIMSGVLFQHAAEAEKKSAS